MMRVLVFVALCLCVSSVPVQDAPAATGSKVLSNIFGDKTTDEASDVSTTATDATATDATATDATATDATATDATATDATATDATATDATATDATATDATATDATATKATDATATDATATDATATEATATDATVTEATAADATATDATAADATATDATATEATAADATAADATATKTEAATTDATATTTATTEATTDATATDATATTEVAATTETTATKTTTEKKVAKADTGSTEDDLAESFQHIAAFIADNHTPLKEQEKVALQNLAAQADGIVRSAGNGVIPVVENMIQSAMQFDMGSDDNINMDMAVSGLLQVVSQLANPVPAPQANSPLLEVVNQFNKLMPSKHDEELGVTSLLALSDDTQSGLVGFADKLLTSWEKYLEE